MRLKRKSLIKKIALVLAGVAALTGIGFGVKAIVDYTKEDLETISPKFEVGNLGADGKWVDDESTLYTKEAFGCYGLQVKPDFDSSVNYQIFYYDILDNFISSTAMLSDGFSGEAPVNGAYARMVIEPRDDEDGKISFTEKISYPRQLSVKIKKEQNVNERFTVFKGQLMQVVTDTESLVFTNNLFFSPEDMAWIEKEQHCATSSTLLKVQGGSTLNFSSKLGDSYSQAYYRVYQFKGLPLEQNIIVNNFGEHSTSKIVLGKDCKYIFICVNTSTENLSWSEEALSKLPSCFTITKTK